MYQRCALASRVLATLLVAYLWPPVARYKLQAAWGMVECCELTCILLVASLHKCALAERWATVGSTIGFTAFSRRMRLPITIDPYEDPSHPGWNHCSRQTWNQGTKW